MAYGAFFLYLTRDENPCLKLVKTGSFTRPLPAGGTGQSWTCPVPLGRFLPVPYPAGGLATLQTERALGPVLEVSCLCGFYESRG